MKATKILLVMLALASFNLKLETLTCFAQCIPDIRIDGNSVIADENHPYGLKLPSWLKTGQTLEQGNNVFSISVIEFTVNGTALDYSQNLSITTPVQTVPAGKIWKIESVHKNAQFTPSVVATYSTAGAYVFTPTCSGYYKIQAWGGGGGGDGGDGVNCGSVGGGGGGGGGYTEATFFLSSGTPYSGSVGAGGTAGTYASSPPGGTGGSSIFNGPSSISATGGVGGDGWCTGLGGAGGTGSGGQANVAGQAGANGVVNSSGGTGGTGANGGGVGGAGTISATGGTGIAPGGGGGGTGYAWGYNGGPGAIGRVIISLGGGTISSSRVPCTTLYLHGSSCAATPACPTGWNDAGCGIISTGAFERSCYRCD